MLICCFQWAQYIPSTWPIWNGHNKKMYSTFFQAIILTDVFYHINLCSIQSLFHSVNLQYDAHHTSVHQHYVCDVTRCFVKMNSNENPKLRFKVTLLHLKFIWKMTVSLYSHFSVKYFLEPFHLNLHRDVTIIEMSHCCDLGMVIFVTRTFFYLHVSNSSYIQWNKFDYVVSTYLSDKSKTMLYNNFETSFSTTKLC